MDLGRTFPPIRQRNARGNSSITSKKGGIEPQRKEPRRIAWCVSREFEDEGALGENVPVSLKEESQGIKDRWAKTRPRSTTRHLPDISPIRSSSAAEASFDHSAPKTSTLRAGVYGIRHKALPGVVHFDLSWDLDSVADTTFDSLNEGTHPNKALASVITRRKIQDAEARRQKRLQRKRTANFQYDPSSKLRKPKAAQRNSTLDDNLDEPFEIFVVRSFEIQGNQSIAQRRAEVRDLESVLKGTVVSSTIKQKRTVMRNLLFVLSSQLMRKAFVRWCTVSQIYTELLQLAAALTV